MDTGYVHSLAEQIHQAGLDEAAEVLGNYLANECAADDTNENYRDGVEDALLTLIQHGAADPRCS